MLGYYCEEESITVRNSGQVVAGPWERHGDGVEERGKQSPAPSSFSCFLLPQPPEDHKVQAFPITLLSPSSQKEPDSVRERLVAKLADTVRTHLAQVGLVTPW